MYVAVGNQKTNNANRNGQPCQPMGVGSLRKTMKREYPIVYEEMGIDDHGYYIITCYGSKFRLVKCKPVCEAKRG
jgi:hypothetical protein